MSETQAKHVTVRCKSCGAKMKIPVSAAGKKAKCPTCGVVFRVRMRAAAGSSPVAVAPTPPAGRSAVSADDVLPIAPPESLPDEAARPSNLPQPQPVASERTCPSCKKTLPGDAKLCVDCGVYLDTSRSIITTQDENLDQIYVFAQSMIRLISWIIPIGVYPIASEAFGLRKPWVVRGIAIATILISLGCLVAEWTDASARDTLKNLMLWTGDPAAGDQLLDRLERQADFGETENPEMREAFREMAEEAVEEHLASAGEFHPVQLITHAFLHGGILHLVGNMLFLMVLGARVNALVGNIWTLGLYPLLAIIAAGAEMISTAGGPPIPMVGASGAVMGLAGMYLVLFPVHKVHMAAWLRWGIFLPLRLAARFFAVRGFWVVLFYIAFDVVYTVFGLEDDTAHWAHLGGFIGGAVIALILLVGRLIDARGGDLLSAILGRHAWKLIGRPRQVPNVRPGD